MSITDPASVSSDGTRRVVWVPDGVADKENPQVAELASGLDVSLYLVHGADGFNGVVAQDQIPDNRQGSGFNRTKPGRKNATLSVRYVINEDEPTDNEAWLELVEGTKGDFVQIFQVPEDYDPDTDGGYDGFVSRVWPSELGVQDRMPEEANAVDRCNQPVSVTGPVVYGVVGGS